MYLMPKIHTVSSLLSFVEITHISCRNLFTKEELGVQQFDQLRKNALDCFKNNEEIEKRKAYFVNNFANLRLDEQRNNLKHFILLTDGKPNDLQILKKTLLNYRDTYNNSVHFVKEFCFGTQIMRLFYLLNLPDEAVKFYKDQELRNSFEQMQTYKVMLSLLYKNQRYAEIFDLYKDIRKKLDLYELFPDITVNCLAFAACYHLNTADHFTYAQNLWKESQNVKQLHRSRYFLAGLAMKQNSPEIALSLVDGPSSYVTMRFIRLMAYTQLGEFNKACEILQQTIENYKLNATRNKPCFGKQMITDLQEAIQKSGSEEQIGKIDRIIEEFKSLDLITDETLDQQLCASFPPMLPKNLFLKMKNKTSKFN